MLHAIGIMASVWICIVIAGVIWQSADEPDYDYESQPEND